MDWSPNWAGFFPTPGGISFHSFGRGPGIRISATGPAAQKKVSSDCPPPRSTRPTACARSSEKPPAQLRGIECEFEPAARQLGRPGGVVRSIKAANQDSAWFFSATSRWIVFQVQSCFWNSACGRRSQRSPRSNDRRMVLSCPQSNPPNRPLPKGIASSHLSIGAASFKFSDSAGRNSVVVAAAVAAEAAMPSQRNARETVQYLIMSGPPFHVSTLRLQPAARSTAAGRGQTT